MNIVFAIALGAMVAGFVLAVLCRNVQRANRRAMSTGDSTFMAWSDGGSGSDCAPGDAGCGDGGGGGGDGGSGD